MDATTDTVASAQLHDEVDGRWDTVTSVRASHRHTPTHVHAAVNTANRFAVLGEHETSEQELLEHDACEHDAREQDAHHEEREHEARGSDANEHATGEHDTSDSDAHDTREHDDDGRVTPGHESDTREHDEQVHDGREIRSTVRFDTSDVNNEIRGRVERYMASGRAPDWWFNMRSVTEYVHSWSSNESSFWGSTHWRHVDTWMRSHPATDPNRSDRRVRLEQRWGAPSFQSDGRGCVPVFKSD